MIQRVFQLGVAACAVVLCSCGRTEHAAAGTVSGQDPTVGVVKVADRPMNQDITISSELVPFQEIDVYAKVSGYVKQLYVDVGTHVHAGQLMAVLELPEMEAQLQERKASISAQQDEVMRAQKMVNQVSAQRDVVHLQYERLAGVSKQNPGMVAQQEVDEAQGKDLASQAQVESAQGALEAARNQLKVAGALLAHDQAMFDYSRITAPFDGVVTQRYANLGALMQAGTSSTQTTPLVKLSQENLYRLVIPVPESYVRYVHVGETVEVRVPAIGKSFQGKVTRFSVDVTDSTRTMHTEVDIPNTSNSLVPGLYAEAVLTLSDKPSVVAVPVQAVSHEQGQSNVMIVDGNHRIQERPIIVGLQTANYVEVTKGVSPGEEVVVSDRSGLKAGESVKPQLVEAMAYAPNRAEEASQP